jgi:hypothetical protein
MPAVSPTLNILQAGSDVILSWPSSTPSSFVLEGTNVLDATTIGAASWPSAGTPSVVGTNYVVTNTASSSSRFYRLHNPSRTVPSRDGAAREDDSGRTVCLPSSALGRT